MQTPGLTDIYAFGEWLKREYIGDKRKPLLITPVVGGLIKVGELKEEHYGVDTTRTTGETQ